MNETELRELVKRIIEEEMQPKIPIGVSNHHIHLTQSDFDTLFPGQEMTVKVPLKQPGEFASNQTVTILGPKGEINNVRILGPCRKRSQVELSKTEARQIGVNVPIRMSGDLDGTPSVIVKTKEAQIEIQGAIAAKRHIHMSEKDAEMLDVKKGQVVKVSVESEGRRTIFDDVIVRPDPKFVLEMHIDTDEANAANVGKGCIATLVKE
ncbi:phosphate propanoyltransferase [Vagococcus hydrophili]|uniref:Phosphate propanoyltransferase n=1 Tax=Vagococcus hydrophili TaxID=2714947 RepID=A0A6G8AQA0_9ENTE|nr:phosphate propanoyltransferase [Vagococcus hydrophili]QIL47160.1 phosphate propanoyltransferase [Vagococcus hydrophili]